MLGIRAESVEGQIQFTRFDGCVATSEIGKQTFNLRV